MDIKDYFGVLWRRKYIILLTTIAALVVAIFGTRLIKPVYEASATVRVATTAGGPLNYTASTYSAELINTAAQIAGSRPMLDDLKSRLKLNETPLITAAAVPETELIKITVEYTSAKMAAQIANALADMLIAQSDQLYTGGKMGAQEVLATQLADYKAEVDQARRQYDAIVALTPPAPEKAAAALDLLGVKQRNYETLLLDYNDAVLGQQVRAGMMTVVEPAVPPGSPIRPQATYNYLLGLAMGLLAGIVLAFVVDSFDPTLHVGKDVEKLAALPIQAKVPKGSRQQLRMIPNDASATAEAYRNLAMSIILADRQQPEKVVLVMSAEPAQGKSTLTANLATALAEYGRNVVAVDCDMRRPKLHEFFALSNDSGLGNVLEQGSELKNELKHPADCISVVTSGAQPANPSQALSSPRMARVVSELRQQFDFVLLDTPALLSVSDAFAIIHNAERAENLDAFLLVVRQSRAQRAPVQEAAEALRKFADKRAGIVLIGTDSPAGYAYYRPGRAHIQRPSEPETEQGG